MCVYCYYFRVSSGLASADWQPAAGGYKNIPHWGLQSKATMMRTKSDCRVRHLLLLQLRFLSAKPQQIGPVRSGFPGDKRDIFILPAISIWVLNQNSRFPSQPCVPSIHPFFCSFAISEANHTPTGLGEVMFFIWANWSFQADSHEIRVRSSDGPALIHVS